MARTRQRREARRYAEGARGTSRAAGRAGTSRAIGEPSAALQKAAAWERAYVVKDFRRIGVTVAFMLLLLALSGFGVNALLR